MHIRAYFGQFFVQIACIYWPFFRAYNPLSNYYIGIANWWKFNVWSPAHTNHRYYHLVTIMLILFHCSKLYSKSSCPLYLKVSHNVLFPKQKLGDPATPRRPPPPNPNKTGLISWWSLCSNFQTFFQGETQKAQPLDLWVGFAKLRWGSTFNLVSKQH